MPEDFDNVVVRFLTKLCHDQIFRFKVVMAIVVLLGGVLAMDDFPLGVIMMCLAVILTLMATRGKWRWLRAKRELELPLKSELTNRKKRSQNLPSSFRPLPVVVSSVPFTKGNYPNWSGSNGKLFGLARFPICYSLRVKR